jgi:hypothetical protein
MLSEASQVLENGLSDSFAAVGRFDEEVFHVNTRPSDKGRESLEVHGKSDRLVVDIREYDFGYGTRSKQSVAQSVFVGNDRIEKPLIFCKLSDEA